MQLMLRVTLSNGRVLEMSASHPLPGGVHFDDLHAGTALDGAEVLDAQLVSYDRDATYDILPASRSGTYFAAGILVASTLAGQ